MVSQYADSPQRFTFRLSHRFVKSQFGSPVFRLVPKTQRSKHWKLHLYQLLNRIHQLPAMNNTPVRVNCKAEKRRKKSCDDSQLSFSDNY